MQSLGRLLLCGGAYPLKQGVEALLVNLNAPADRCIALGKHLPGAPGMSELMLPIRLKNKEGGEDERFIFN